MPIINKIVAFVIPSLTIGGAEHQTVNQINYLVEAGYFNIRLLILSNVFPLLDKINLDKQFVGYISQNSEIAIEKNIFKQLPLIVKETDKFFKQQKVTDVIAILPMAHLVTRMVKGLRKLKFQKEIILNSYYRDVYYQASPLDTAAKKAFNKFNSGLAYLFDNRTLFISQAVLKDISANIFVRNSLVLPNSLPIREVSADLGQKHLTHLNLNAEGQYLILIPGRLHPKKNHLLFVNAFRKFIDILKLEPTKIKVLLVGDGDFRRQIENKIYELNLTDYFSLNGYTDNILLLSLYKCADLVIIPSKHEGFGNVAIEGLMQKSLMLVSNTGGLAEIIKDGYNGFIFENDNEDSLLQKILYLYRNRHDIIIDKDNLWQDFINNYTLESQINKILRFCELIPEN